MAVAERPTRTFRDLRDWLKRIDDLGELRVVRGARSEDEIGMATERKVGIVPLLERRHAELLESRGLLAGKRLESEVGERRSPPQPQRFMEKT